MTERPAILTTCDICLNHQHVLVYSDHHPGKSAADEGWIKGHTEDNEYDICPRCKFILERAVHFGFFQQHAISIKVSDQERQ